MLERTRGLPKPNVSYIREIQQKTFKCESNLLYHKLQQNAQPWFLRVNQLTRMERIQILHKDKIKQMPDSTNKIAVKK